MRTIPIPLPEKRKNAAEFISLRTRTVGKMQDRPGDGVLEIGDAFSPRHYVLPYHGGEGEDRVAGMNKLAIVAMAAALTGGIARAADSGAGARMEAYDAAVIAVMKQGLPIQGRADRFGGIVSAYYDIPAIAATVAGPGWASAPAADRAAFSGALAHHSATSLAQNFKRYGGERFVVDPAVRPRAGGSVVKVTIDRDTLYFQLRQGTSGWKIVDVISGGVSQLAVQRSELAGIIASGGLSAAAKRLQEIDARTLAKG